jgi:hypothetical protein
MLAAALSRSPSHTWTLKVSSWSSLNRGSRTTQSGYRMSPIELKTRIRPAEVDGVPARLPASADHASISTMDHQPQTIPYACWLWCQRITPQEPRHQRTGCRGIFRSMPNSKPEPGVVRATATPIGCTASRCTPEPPSTNAINSSASTSTGCLVR